MFDRANATVILRAGEFVILKTQFRVGGSKLALDCQGFPLLKFLSLRYRVCANLSPVDMRTPPALEEPDTMLAAPFDQAAILAYYDDYLKKGMFPLWGEYGKTSRSRGRVATGKHDILHVCKCDPSSAVVEPFFLLRLPLKLWRIDTMVEGIACGHRHKTHCHVGMIWQVVIVERMGFLYWLWFLFCSVLGLVRCRS